MAKALVAAQQFENSMLKAYIRDWPADNEESSARQRPNSISLALVGPDQGFVPLRRPRLADKRWVVAVQGRRI